MLNVLQRVHEPDFKLMKWFSPSEDQVYVDVGSNRGEAITSMLIMNKTKTKIIGFEPNYETYKKLADYVANKQLVTVHNLGLGTQNSTSTLYVPFYRNWMFDGLASFNYKNAKDWLRNRMYGYNEALLTIKESNCTVKKLDDFDLKPYFIKIDVQGLELEVLQGARETLKKNMPLLLIESLNQECMDYLSPLGYQFYHFKSGVLYKGVGRLNTFCIDLRKHGELKIVVNG